MVYGIEIPAWTGPNHKEAKGAPPAIRRMPLLHEIKY